MGFTGTIFPDVCNCVGANGVPTGAGFGCVLLVIQQLFHFLMYFGVLAAVAFIAYAGFLLIINPTNPGNVTKGRTIMLDAVIGLVVVLAAWLIVNTLFSVLTTGSLSGYTAVFGSTSGNCLPTATDQQGTSSGVTGGFTGGPTVSQGGGSCSVASGGPCDSSQLGAFGADASQASQICLAESSGNPSIASGVDKMSNDPQHRSFSFGLFQINLTQHQVGGLNCPSAFSGKNFSATVVNESLYAQCVAAAKDPNQNIAVAAQMWAQDNGSFHEWSTASKCGISMINGPLMAIASCDTNTI
jgi:hypothetical protein